MAKKKSEWQKKGFRGFCVGSHEVIGGERVFVLTKSPQYYRSDSNTRIVFESWQAAKKAGWFKV
jgi:hypothetical protein